jgi:DNA segregation ATPase FtsK/SpoIIIE, S-DNA-T family
MIKIKEYFVKKRLKGDLVKCFRDAKIYKEIKHKGNSYKKYPTIHDVKVDEEKQTVRFVFTIPVGLNPEEITNKEWVFVQMFSTAYTLDCRKNRRFTLTVYANGFPPLEAKPFDLETYRLQALSYRVPLLTGYDEKNNMLFIDLLEDPHLLVMGETGSGKSVYLRSALVFLFFHLKERVEFVLGDMKRSEFFLFRNLPTVKGVYHDEKKLEQALKKAHDEMLRRGDLFDAAEVPNIKDYEKETGVKLPYIVVAIDEVALLKDNKEVMYYLERISCIGRSSGVILILSLQRGDAKVLDGQLKINLTNRAVFRTTDKINSTIGLGAGVEADASTIAKSHKGEFYFKSDDLTLIHAPLLEVDDAKALLAPFKVPKIKDPLPELEVVREEIQPFHDELDGFTLEMEEDKNE